MQNRVVVNESRLLRAWTDRSGPVGVLAASESRSATTAAINHRRTTYESWLAAVQDFAAAMERGRDLGKDQSRDQGRDYGMDL